MIDEQPDEISVQEDVALHATMPGRQLKAMREAKGLRVDEVAQMLKFGVRQVEALEADDYQSLQGATFVRGFIRAYAKLLKTDAAPLLAMLEASAPPVTAEISAPSNMGDAVPLSFAVRYQKALLSLMALLVLGVVGLYLYWGPGSAQEPKSLAMTEPTTEPATPEALPPAAPANLIVSPPAVEQLPNVVPTPSVVAEPASAIATPGAIAAPAGNVPAPVQITSKTLVFDFDDRSWVEVKDATQRIVLTGEFPRGNRQVVNAKPPYQLWIGKASGVRVSYGDRRVDLQSYTRDEVARLSLD